MEMWMESGTSVTPCPFLILLKKKFNLTTVKSSKGIHFSYQMTDSWQHMASWNCYFRIYLPIIFSGRCFKIPLIRLRGRKCKWNITQDVCDGEDGESNSWAQLVSASFQMVQNFVCVLFFPFWAFPTFSSPFWVSFFSNYKQ